jgi:hypothetical protein
MGVGGGVVLGLAGLFVAIAQMQAEETRVSRREAAAAVLASGRLHEPGGSP